MSNIIDSTNVGRLVSDIKAKADLTYWPIDQTTEVDLATVATTGSYNDLIDKPTAATGAIVYVGTCPTAAATATKVVTTETFPTQNGNPVVGIVIGVKFAITNTATEPKLNVNGLGAQSIYYNAAVATSTSAVYGGTKNRYTYYMWDGTNWCWLSQGLDSNDNTLAYQIRTSAQRLPVATACYRYRLLFTSADGTKWVPANASSSTNATASRTPATAKINPFGQIAYYSYTTALSSGGQPSASYQYQQYAGVTIGYSFNNTGAAATMTSQKPIYVKCAPQTDGSAIIDSTTPYVQALPSTADGKIYIFLGIATSATAFELLLNHPVYEFKNGAIRLWTNASTTASLSDLSDVSSTAPTDGQALIWDNANSTWKPGAAGNPNAESTNNKVTSLSSSSTDTQYPSAKAVFDFITDDEYVIASAFNDVNNRITALCPDTVGYQPVDGMLPNVYYNLGTLTGSVTLKLANPTNLNIENEYKFQFTAGSTAPTITWPTSVIKWQGGSAPTITANRTYKVSIINGLALAIEYY